MVNTTFQSKFIIEGIELNKNDNEIQIEDEKFKLAQIEPLKDNWDFDKVKITQTQYSTHFYHHYTAKFIPQIPQNVIKQYGKKGDIIFDPFLGSGTTLVESKLQKFKSAGIDINPFSVKISKSKIQSIDYIKFNQFLIWLKEQNDDCASNIPDIDLFTGSCEWFRIDVRYKLYNILEQIKTLDDATKNFIEVGISDQLKGISNAMMHRTIPTLPKQQIYIDKKHYDREINNNTRKIDTYNRIYNQLNRMEKALKFLETKSEGTEAFAIEGDSKNLIKNLNGVNIEEINFIVTSPPYWNAQNYQKLHSLSYKLFGLKEPGENEIGRRKVNYLNDMEKVIKQLSQITKGYFAFVIGEDTNGGALHQMLHDLILSNGFEDEKIIKRKLSMQASFTKDISHEYIYIFRSKK